jgi:hypothetical protein
MVIVGGSVWLCLCVATRWYLAPKYWKVAVRIASVIALALEIWLNAHLYARLIQ